MADTLDPVLFEELLNALLAPGVNTVLLTGPRGSVSTAWRAVFSSDRAIDAGLVARPLDLYGWSHAPSSSISGNARLDRFVERSDATPVLIAEDVDTALRELPRAQVLATLTSTDNSTLLITSTDPDLFGSSADAAKRHGGRRRRPQTEQKERLPRIDAIVRLDRPPSDASPASLASQASRGDADACMETVLSGLPALLALDFVILEACGSLPYPPWGEPADWVDPS